MNQKIDESINLYNKKNFYEALEVIDSLLENNINNNNAHNLRGAILRALGKKNESLLSYDEAIRINPNDFNSYNNKANVLMDLKKFKDAEFIYKKCLKINNNNYVVLCNLSDLYCEIEEYEKSEIYATRASLINNKLPRAYRILGVAQKKLDKKDKAIESFKRHIELTPEANDVIHQIDILEGNNPETTPPEFITNIFDSYAYRFEDHLLNDLNYSAPNVIEELIKKYFDENKIFKNILDLGCGTGLNGVFLKPLCENLVGVDLSENMLKKSEEKLVYNRLIKNDFFNFLENEIFFYDLFLATDVFIYTGKLEKIFELISMRSHKEAWFIFTTEYQKNGNYKLQETGRYSHSIKYIKDICIKNNFEIDIIEDFNLRLQDNIWIRGNMFLVKILNKKGK